MAGGDARAIICLKGLILETTARLIQPPGWNAGFAGMSMTRKKAIRFGRWRQAQSLKICRKSGVARCATPLKPNSCDSIMTPNEDDLALSIAKTLVGIYQSIYERSMADVPICNGALRVDQTGFQLYDGHVLGIVVTPWFMNLVSIGLPDQPLPPAQTGDRRSIALPAGNVELTVGEVPGFGRLDACSLFSPMQDFEDHAAVMATATEVLMALFTGPDPEPTPPPVMDREMGRRNLLRGNFKKPEPQAPL